MEPISARALGKPVDGSLASYPVDQAQVLLLSNSGLTSTDLHGPSWAKARTFCEAQG